MIAFEALIRFVPTNGFMGTNIEPTIFDTNRRRNERHSGAFMRSVVEQSYLPDTSVAHLARNHGINANQIFAWRKLFRDTAFPTTAGSDVALIRVALSDTIVTVPSITPPKPSDGGTVGIIELDVGKVRLTIRGTPDTPVLEAVRARLLR